MWTHYSTDASSNKQEGRTKVTSTLRQQWSKAITGNPHVPLPSLISAVLELQNMAKQNRKRSKWFYTSSTKAEKEHMLLQVLKLGALKNLPSAPGSGCWQSCASPAGASVLLRKCTRLQSRLPGCFPPQESSIACWAKQYSAPLMGPGDSVRQRVPPDLARIEVADESGRREVYSNMWRGLEWTKQARMAGSSNGLIKFGYVGSSGDNLGLLVFLAETQLWHTSSASKHCCSSRHLTASAPGSVTILETRTPVPREGSRPCLGHWQFNTHYL